MSVGYKVMMHANCVYVCVSVVKGAQKVVPVSCVQYAGKRLLKLSTCDLPWKQNLDMVKQNFPKLHLATIKR